ncbi:MAG: NAD(P)/FAD-dependent oxidoreductase [Nevskiales bacterium]
MKIAVIGTGISGLAAAWLLQRKHEVVLFERETRAGGHTNTFIAQTAAGAQPIDTGFIVYNEPCYPNLTALFRELGVATRSSDMSFGVSIGEGRYEYAGDNLFTLFVQPSNLFSPRHLGMLLEILRLNRLTKLLLRQNTLPEITLGEFLDKYRFGSAIRSRYLLPMCGAIWSTSTRGCLDFPYPAFARFFDSHGLLNAIDRPQWRTVVGGSQAYVQKLLADFRGELRLNCAVTGLTREDRGVTVSSARGAEHFDAAICATHSDQALKLLRDANDSERVVLEQVRFAANRSYLHTDETLLPLRRRAWSSWNYMGRGDELNDDPISVTYWMNRLMGIAGPVNYIVSLNPPREPVAGTILLQLVYEHPQFTPATIAAQQRLGAIQGSRHIWYAGAWTRYGFHEDGLRSALLVAKDFNCLPAWAQL